MIFQPFYRWSSGCAAYLFGCGGLGKCAVVDAHEHDVDTYADLAAAKGMRITHVIDTHVHADHRSGGPTLASKVGAGYCLHESADVEVPFIALRDGEEIELGNTRVKVLHTPGHTPESLHQKLLTLPDDLEVYPAHFAGSACGVGMSGKASSTIAFEKRWNSMLTKTEGELVAALADVPPKPDEMAAILAHNSGRR